MLSDYTQRSSTHGTFLAQKLLLPSRLILASLGKGRLSMAAAHPWLLAGADDRCCVVCYTCWFQDYLEPRDLARLNAIAADCPCDFLPGFAKSFKKLGIKPSEDTEKSNLGGASKEKAQGS